MGNSPSEANGATCVCGRRLPPCDDWDDIVKKTVDRTVDKVYVYEFLQGRYYRPYGISLYYCPECFWKPKHDYIRKQEEEKKKREEKERQRREEIARQKEEARKREIARQQEEARQREELERRKEEEAALKEALSEQEERSAERLEELSLGGEKEEKESVQTQTYKLFEATESSRMQLGDYSSDYYEDVLNEDVISFEKEEIEEIDIVSSDLVSSVSFSLDLMTQDEELSYGNATWLRSAQTLLLTHYLQSSHFSSYETDIVLDFLAYLQPDLSDKECLLLAKTLNSLTDTHPSDFTTTFKLDESLPLPAKLSSLLLQSGRIYNENNLWMQKCLHMLVSTITEDIQLSKIFLEITCKNWSSYDWLRLFQRCSKANLSASVQKHILYLVQTYCLPPVFVKNLLKSDPSGTVAALEYQVRNELNKSLMELINEIQDTKLVDEDLLRQVEKIAKSVYKILEESNIDIKLDYEKHLAANMSKSLAVLQRLEASNENALASDDEIAGAIITLMCAIQKVKPFYPRKTQVLSLLLLILTAKNQSNRLLEIMTGEGKSCVVAMFATVLGIQGKHIDIVTSSPILALRDAEEWASYYQIFNLNVSHNTDLERAKNVDMDEVKRECYKNNIVYGTIGNFSADILREEFEQKRIRSGRRFDTVIVDEVDMLMLDEGVQFTYLSHNASILHHMEPVLAAVWGLIGPMKLTMSVNGNVIYAGTPKLFTEAIFDCLDPEFSQVEHPEQVLATAMEVGVISDEQFQRLTAEDQEERKTAIAQLKKSDALALLSSLQDYDNMPEFQAYAVKENSLIEAVTSVTSEETAEKLLLLENGLACILNTKEEVQERGLEILKSKLKFSDDEGDAAIKLPKFLKEFVLDQIPTYIDNAVRALHMEEDREYAISHGKIIPVDFQNSGVMEQSKKWGGGLQQMLEMKHNLSLSSMSLVTNFMSNIEFFSRYREQGGIYGMSGTLGLDPHSSTSKILSELYNVTVCSIPTFKVRKLYEKPAIIVENEEKWYKQIISTVEEESKEEADWKKGRATLILCEDIKSAEDLRKYVVEKAGWKKEKVYLYAHSNSKQLTHIKKKLGPGEVIIATNLAGRGTNIKVSDEVNDSGGLLCLVTFLPRNRRVELQAFGRTARSGRPGSVRCILDYSSLPTKYEGLDIHTIRKLRAAEELLRLNQLIDSDMKEVQLRELLFRDHCQFLQQIHLAFEKREDLSLVVSIMNENWGQWLQMKTKQISCLEEEQLLKDLAQVQLKWKPSVPESPTDVVHLPVANFYHLIQFGNQLLIEKEEENAQKAAKYYDEGIRLEPRYALIAYYNRAYCTINAEIDGYKTKSLKDITAALDCLQYYIDEASSIYQCVSTVRQVRKIKEREAEDDDEDAVGDFTSQMQARFEIFRFLREKMEEAIGKIKELSGGTSSTQYIRGKVVTKQESGEDFIAKPVGIFSLIPDADYITNLEITSLWSMGLEIVYSIEKKPEFCWSGLICFFLGLAQIVAGVLLTVFTVGTAASIGMGLISEGISDCISGIEGMVTGDFSWTEWATAKAIGLALSLISGGISRLATTGMKSLKVGYKVAARVGRQLKAIPRIVKSSIGSAAKANLKNASKYVAKEAVLQGVSYAQNQAFDAAFKGLIAHVGDQCKEGLMRTLQKEFAEGYLGQVVDWRYTALLDESFSSKSEVPMLMQTKAEHFFSNIGDTVIHNLVSDSEIKRRLQSVSLSLFSQISDKSPKGGKVAFIANLAEMAVMGAIVTDTVKSLNFFTDQFVPETKEVCKKLLSEEGTSLQLEAGTKYQSYNCTKAFKEHLADHVGDVFGEAVSTLLQTKLGSMVSHVLNKSIGRLSHRVLDKYIVRSDRTLEDLTAGQHANYIRSVGVDTSDLGPSSRAVVSVYADHVAQSSSPGSLMDLRIASEHFGQGIIIYNEKNGKFVKNCSINPSIKKNEGNIELVYIPPADSHLVGHYDVLVRGERVRVEAEKSNCLFHAYALGRNPSLLSHDQLKQEAERLRQTVVQTIRDEPQKWGEHINLRVQMDNLRQGNRFALIGAGPRNKKTKVTLYKQEAEKDEVFTMYEQANNVQAKAVQKYNKALKVDDNGYVTTSDARLESFKIRMDGCSLKNNAGMRCWDTKPVTGMIKRHNGKAKDSEVSYHLVPSRAGANSGDQYANGVMASPNYNDREKEIWTPAVKAAIGDEEFGMTVNGSCGRVAQDYKGDRRLGANTQQKLKERFEKIEAVEPRAYRVEECDYTLHLPPGTTKKALDDIKNTSTLKVTTDDTAKTATFSMGADTELFVPKDTSKLKDTGEMNKNELSLAKKKRKKQKIGAPPSSATKRVSKAKVNAFKKQFDEFQKEGL